MCDHFREAGSSLISLATITRLFFDLLTTNTTRSLQAFLRLIDKVLVRPACTGDLLFFPPVWGRVGWWTEYTLFSAFLRLLLFLSSPLVSLPHLPALVALKGHILPLWYRVAFTLRSQEHLPANRFSRDSSYSKSIFNTHLFWERYFSSQRRFWCYLLR